MRLREKAQISFEFMVLFGFVMLLFLIVGTVIVTGIENTKDTESQADYLVKEIKSAMIIASLSESDFETRVKLPETITGNEIYITIARNPDNFIVIEEKKSAQDYKIIAREFLPATSSQLNHFRGSALLIKKTITKTNEQITEQITIVGEEYG